MADNRTMTAALAIVKRNGKAIAKIRSLSLTETIGRGTVRELGKLTKSEVPPTAIDCTAQFDFYNVNLIDTTIPDAYPRVANTVKDFVDHILLQDGVQVEIYKKIEDAINPVTGLKKSKPVIFATIKEMFIDSDRFSIASEQVSDKSQSFQYLEPVLFQL